MAHHPIKANLAGNVRYLRLELRWSQEDLAQRVGVSVPTISGIERGIRNPSLEMIIALSEALGVTVAFLLDDPSPARAIAIVERGKPGPATKTT